MSDEQIDIVKTLENKQRVNISATDEKQKDLIPEQNLRAALKAFTKSPCDPQILLQEFYDSLKKYEKAENKNEIQKQLLEKMCEALPVIALDTHYALARAVLEDLRPFAIEFSNQLITEYECKTPTEKALAETVAAAYVRIIQFTQVMTRQARDEHCSQICNNFYKVASQELDRANRHFLTVLTTLRQFKSPLMKVTVKAENAFVAQNQQVNTKAPDNGQPKQTEYEINDHK